MNELIAPAFKTVMIIDDSTIDIYVASRTIKKIHFAETILEFAFARNALEYLRDNQENAALLPQLIFVDIYMPVMSGFQFMEAYGQLPDTLKRNCQVYIISSSIDDNDIHRAKNDSNVVAFYEKPITKEFLNRILTER